MAAAGRQAMAQEQLVLARDYAERYEQWGHAADELLALGELALAQGDQASARRPLQQAREQATRCGMRTVLQRVGELAAALPPA